MSMQILNWQPRHTHLNQTKIKNTHEPKSSNQKKNRQNSKDPEKLTTEIDKGRHEQRVIIHKKQIPNNASEAQNPPHTTVVVIVIIRKTKLKSI